MSKQGPAGSLTLVILIVVLGFVGLIVEPIIFLAFIAVLGYYLYKVERRLMDLEAAAVSRGILPPKKPDKE